MTYKQELIEIYHNIYKDIHGVRPRHINFDSMSIADLQDDLNLLDAQQRYHNEPVPTQWNDHEPVSELTSKLQEL